MDELKNLARRNRSLTSTSIDSVILRSEIRLGEDDLSFKKSNLSHQNIFDARKKVVNKFKRKV